MFNFFKDKFKNVLSKFSKEVEEEVEETPKPEEKKEIIEEEKLKEIKEEPKKQKKEAKEIKKAETVEEIKEELVEEKSEEKKGFFKKITEAISKKALSEKQFDELFFELEIVLMENNVAVEVIEKIKQDLKNELVEKQVLRKKVKDIILDTLKKSLNELFEVDKINLVEKVKKKKPFIICFVGINGSGKTTTIAKICRLLQKNNLKCVLAAADTFRAASIEQLQIHADKLGVRMIKHDYGSDSAAVAYDAIKYAQAKKEDIVLIDTAGRLHSNVNLMDEVKKLVRVAKPDLTIFVGESITGNDCVEQAKKFDEIVGIDGIILTKSDVDEKGGTAISVSYVTKKPILYLGTGQEYNDLQEFDPELIISGIGL